MTALGFPVVPEVNIRQAMSLARQLIEINVREQADDWPEDEIGQCPTCGGAARKAPDEPRVLKTTQGDVAWKQRVGNCPRCRRAFFPSGSSARD